LGNRPIFEKIIFSKGRNEIIFAVESPYALANKKSINLGNKVIIYQHKIELPYLGVKKIFDYIYYKKYGKAITLPEIREKVYHVRKIVVDPGHGGKDPGAIGRNGLKEKDVALSVAKILKSMLEKNGYKVVLTRNRDKFLSLGRRTYIANREKADLFISIHANSSRNRKVAGYEVYYLSEATDDSARALAAAENYSPELEKAQNSYTKNVFLQATIWDMLYSENREESVLLAKDISRSLSRCFVGKNRGVKSARFYVLKGVRIPAVLVEVGFISNPYYEKLMRSYSFKVKVAKGILEAIKEYDRQYLISEGFTK
jgi:N-acetylmuramoyl-L-alanine amidase